MGITDRDCSSRARPREGGLPHVDADLGRMSDKHPKD